MPTNKSIELKDFTKIPVNALKLLGFKFHIDEISVSLTRNQKVFNILRQIYFGFCIGVLLVSLLFYTLWLIVNFHNPLSILRSLPNIVNNVFISFRLITICANRKRLNKLLIMLEGVFPSACDEQNMHKFPKYLYQLTRKEKVYGFFCFVPIPFAIIDFIKNYIESGTEKFIVDIWFPFDYKSSGLYYLFACLFMFMSSVMSSISLYIGDWIIYSLITILSMEFEMTGRKYKEILKHDKVKLIDFKTIIIYSKVSSHQYFS